MFSEKPLEAGEKLDGSTRRSSIVLIPIITVSSSYDTGMRAKPVIISLKLVTTNNACVARDPSLLIGDGTAYALGHHC